MQIKTTMRYVKCIRLEKKGWQYWQYQDWCTGDKNLHVLGLMNWCIGKTTLENNFAMSNRGENAQA